VCLLQTDRRISEDVCFYEGPGVWAHGFCLALRYRYITRGPRKGQWVSRTERRKSRKEQGIERDRAEVQRKLQQIIVPITPPKEAPKQETAIDGLLTLVLVYLGLCLPYLVLFMIMKFLAAHELAWLILPLLLIDVIGGRLYRRRKNLGKHIPFYWLLR
jgi:hypothetical protein